MTGRTTFGAPCFLGAMAAGLALFAPNAGRAGPSAPPLACGHRLSAPLLERWRASGGEGGALGCPLADEADAPGRPGVRMALFARGELVWDGRRAPRAEPIEVTGCFYRLWFQHQGAGGPLGMPLGDARSYPDGRKQDFEGGVMIWQRALDTCFVRPGLPTDSRPE